MTAPAVRREAEGESRRERGDAARARPVTDAEREEYRALERERDAVARDAARLAQVAYRTGQVAAWHGSELYECDERTKQMMELERAAEALRKSQPLPGETAQKNWHNGLTRRMAEDDASKAEARAEAMYARLRVLNARLKDHRGAP